MCSLSYSLTFPLITRDWRQMGDTQSEWLVTRESYDSVGRPGTELESHQWEESRKQNIDRSSSGCRRETWRQRKWEIERHEWMSEKDGDISTKNGDNTPFGECRILYSIQTSDIFEVDAN